MSRILQVEVGEESESKHLKQQLQLIEKNYLQVGSLQVSDRLIWQLNEYPIGQLPTMDQPFFLLG